MAIPGHRLSAARLADFDLVTLSNETPSSASTYEQWGSQTVTFANPGVEVKVAAWGAGEARNNTSTASAGMRIEISLDGGSTWSAGEEPLGNVGANTEDQRENLAAIHYVSGTPSGAIVVRAMLFSSSTASTFQDGSVLALITAV